jgi:putative membrane protein
VDDLTAESEWDEQADISDPCDLNLDLFFTELLCECEALLERLPEGDDDDHFIFERGSGGLEDDMDADDGGDGE